MSTAPSATTTRLTRKTSPLNRHASDFTLDHGADHLPVPAEMDDTVHARHEATLISYRRDPERDRVALAGGKTSSAYGTRTSTTQKAALEDGLKIFVNDLAVVDEEAYAHAHVYDDQGKQGKAGRNGRRYLRASLLLGSGLSVRPLPSRIYRYLRFLAAKRWVWKRMIATVLVFALCFVGVTAIEAVWPGSPTSTQSRSIALSGAVSGLKIRQDHKQQQSPHAVPVSIDRHETSSTGLLIVNPQSRIHPITQLIKDAKEAWEAKLARQSTTLAQAVDEYRRRYGRLPPKGFDHWWRYVRENDVRLPDEYDQIHNDLALFWALSSRELRRRLAEVRTRPRTWTLSIRDGSPRTSLNFDPSTIHNSINRTKEQVDLISEVVRYLPDFDAVYSIDDAPSQYISHNHRVELHERIGDREYFEEHDAIDTTYRGWQAGCSLASPMGVITSRSGRAPARDPMFMKARPFSTKLDAKTFITDHRKSMDPCVHPDLVPIMSTFSGKSPVAGSLDPLFSLSKTTMHADILGVPTEQVELNGKLVPWEERREQTLMWRGRTTGPWHKKKFDWRQSQRTRLVKMSNGAGHEGSQEDGSIVHLLPAVDDLGSPSSTIESKAITAEIGRVNGHYMNVSFTGDPIQCSKDDGSCDALRNDYTYTPRMRVHEAAQFKYVIDVDGNAWSARFQRLISSGSVVFKSTVFPEWWTDRIQPWFHYVPLKADYTDLYDSIAFFRGDLDGRGEHDALAKAMAEQAIEWSATHWRKEDMTAYVFRLYLEWARLVAVDRDAATLSYSADMEV